MLIEYPHSLNLLTDVSYVLQQQNSTISFSSNQITLFIRCQLLCCVYFIILKNQKPIASSAEFQCHFPASYFVTMCFFFILPGNRLCSLEISVFFLFFHYRLQVSDWTYIYIIYKFMHMTASK